jgi:hypothetical protein
MVESGGEVKRKVDHATFRNAFSGGQESNAASVGFLDRTSITGDRVHA